MPHIIGDGPSTAGEQRGWAGAETGRIDLPPTRGATTADALTPPTDATGAPIPEGYRIRVTAHEAVIAASDPDGALYAQAHLMSLSARGELRTGVLTEWPSLPLRGVIEGFYGAPWSHAERLRMLREIGSWRMNRYVYAPKDDPHHRRLWREPYPPAEAARIAELAATAREVGVRMVYAIHPGLDMTFSSEADNAALAARAAELAALGVTDFAVLFDDIEPDVHDAQTHAGPDLEAFGTGPAAAGRAHASVLTRFATSALASLNLTAASLLTVPTDYAGGQRSEYRDAFASGLPDGCTVMWTGSDIVVGAVSAEDAAAASDAFGGHGLLLWDNFPVNDFDRSRAFLGPLSERDPGMVGEGLAGILTNPMVEFEPGRLAMHTVAQWAWDPARYDAEVATQVALADVAGTDADALAPLVEAASSWPPSRLQHPRLERLALHALEDPAATVGSDARRVLDEALAGLWGVRDLGTATPLRQALAAWGIGASLTATTIDAAVRLTHGEAREGAVVDAWESARHHPRGIALDVAKAVAEKALGRELPDQIKPKASEIDA